MDYFRRAKSQAKMAVVGAQGLGQHLQTQYQQSPAWNHNSTPQAQPQQQSYGQTQHHGGFDQHHAAGYQSPQSTNGYGYQHTPPIQHPQYTPPPAKSFDMNLLHQALPTSPPTSPSSPYYHPPMPHTFPPSPQYPPSHINSFPASPKYPPGTPNTFHTSREYPEPSPPPIPYATRPGNIEIQTQQVTSRQAPQTPVIQSRTQCPRYEEAPCESVGCYVFTPLARARVGLNEDEFSICHACYWDYIAPYPHLSAGFMIKDLEQPTYKGAPAASPVSTTCDLALPTVRTLVLRECIAERSFSPLLRFARTRAGEPECGGDAALPPGEAFFVRGADDFAVCRRCYGAYLRGTALDGAVERRHLPVAWLCDAGLRGYAFRALTAELDGGAPDLARFVARANARAALEECPGDRVALARPGERRLVYRPRDGRSGVFCRACFFDHVKDTPVESHFDMCVELEEHLKGKLICNLASRSSQFAMRCAVRFRDDEVWRKAVTGRSSLPPCKGLVGVDEEELQGQQSEANEWYCVTAHPKVEVCRTCYVTTVELLGAAHLFSAVRRPLVPGVVRMCYLATPNDIRADRSSSRNFENTLVWRGAVVRDWLHHGFDSIGNFAAFEQVAAAMATWPAPCASDARLIKAASGRRWYGNRNLAEGDEHKVGIACCEECFANYIKGTPLEGFLGVDVTERIYDRNSAGFACNAYTDRVRQVLSEACQAGDFLIFARYWARRKDVEARWKAINELCQKQAEKQAVEAMLMNAQASSAAYTKLMGQLAANTSATIMSVGGSVAEAAASDCGQRYGNTTVGHGYLTQGGASAALAHLDAQKLAGQAAVRVEDYRPSGNTWQDTQTLLQMSQAIGEEWDAVK